jgi:hypothetical protein
VRIRRDFTENLLWTDKQWFVQPVTLLPIHGNSTVDGFALIIDETNPVPMKAFDPGNCFIYPHNPLIFISF